MELTRGQRIEQERVRRGLSRRKMASKLGISTRQMVALEKDTVPVPKLEKRVIYKKYIDFLGYDVWLYEDWAVSDKKFDLEIQQSRALEYFETGQLSRN